MLLQGPSKAVKCSLAEKGAGVWKEDRGWSVSGFAANFDMHVGIDVQLASANSTCCDLLTCTSSRVSCEVSVLILMWGDEVAAS